MADPIDYTSGNYGLSGVQQLLQTMLPRWNTQWEDPSLQGGYQSTTGAPVTLGGVEDTINSAINNFTQQVQAVTGQAPTADQINSFFQNQLVPLASQQQPGGYNPLTQSNVMSAIQSYIPTAFAPQIQQNQTTQQTNALNQNVASGENLINQATGTFAKNLTDPTNSLYQSFAGNMNNMGITPSSGAFQAGVGSTIANENQGLQSQLMTSLGFPALGGIQGLSGQANANLQGAAPGAASNLTNQSNQMNDFAIQQQIAQLLQRQSQPSGLQQGIGMAGGIGQAAGGVGQGIGGLSSATWICTAMEKHGVITREEINDLHDHLYKAFWKRPFKFIGYILFGKLLVLMAESVGTDWNVWKPCFYQEVMAETDSVKAVSIYEQSFWTLYRNVKRRIDKRFSMVYHEGTNHGTR